jgi:hypothetical protein
MIERTSSATLRRSSSLRVMRRITIAAISVLALLVAVAWAGAARPQRKMLAKCVPGHSHLIAIDTRAQVYFAPEPGEAGAEAVYGCAYGRRRSYFIGKIADCGSSGCVGVEHEVLAGPLVAYEDFSIGGVGSMSASHLVVVRDLRSGRFLRKLPTGMSGSSNPKIIGTSSTTAIVLRSDGAVAWIVEPACAGAAADGPTCYEVHAVDRTGSRILASGTDIDPHSLALAGSTLYWTQGGKPFAATLK